MTATSLFPKIAAHAGLEFGVLLEEMLGAATLHSVPKARERRLAQVAFVGPDRRAVSEVERH
jgi:hypothetical protein